MRFKVSPAATQPLYVQLTQQIRHAIDTGVLQPGDVLPGIRTLAEELVVSPNTIVKAYADLEHEGLLEMRHGSGAFVAGRRPSKAKSDRVRHAQERVRALVERLRNEGFDDDEIQRLVEAELFYRVPAEKR
jgi:GntR family transcriptional regulator